MKQTSMYVTAVVYASIELMLPPVDEMVTTLYSPGDTDEYEGWEIPHEDASYATPYEASLRYDVRELPGLSEYFDLGSLAYRDRRLLEC